MNKLITNKITLILFAVITCHLTARAQDSAKKVIVVVRPGGITKTTPSSTLASQSNNKLMASAPGAPGSGSLKPATPAITSVTGTQKTAVTAAAVPQKPVVKPYVAPGSRIHTYASPSTAERAGTATYAPHAVVTASKQGAPTGAGTAVPVTAAGSNTKYAAAPPASVSVAVVPAVVPAVAAADNSGKYAAAAPAPGSSVVTPAITPPSKKDTIVVTKIKTDTVVVPPAKHTGNKIIFAEIGGPGIAISVNYDARFKAGQKDGFGWRAGVGYFAAGNNTVFTIPVQVNYLYGKDGKYLELGLGTTFVNSRGDNYSSPTWEFDTVTGLAATAVIGVRYEPNKAINFRLGYVPIVSSYGLINAGGFSVGYTF